MRVGMHFALIHEASLVIMEKFDGVLDRNHVLFALAVDLVEHGRERRRLSGAGRTGDQYQAARLVAQVLYDEWQTESVKTLDFPGNGTKNRCDGPTLLEKVAAEAGQIFQPERKIEFKVFLETVFLRVSEHTVGQRLGIGGGHRRHVHGAKMAMNADPRRAVRRNMQLPTAGLDHFFQQLTQCYTGHL